MVLHPPELELKMGILLGGGGTAEIQSRLLVEELQSPAVMVLLVAAAELQWRGSGGAPIGGSVLQVRLVALSVFCLWL
jgi:hypothetical protein